MTFDEALVLGAGVSGLTTAVRLQDAGLAVRILTRDEPETLVSRVAAALWHPYRAYPVDRVNAWSLDTLKVFRELAHDPDAGVVFRPVVELFRQPAPELGWRRWVDGARKITPEELDEWGADRYVDGWVLDLPVIETPVYMPWLARRFQAAGGTMEIVPEGAPPLDELTRPDRPVVCCIGLGAREYLDDDEVFPIRGQVVSVDNPGLERAVVDDEGPGDPTYVIPRSRDVILGGTASEGLEDREADPDLTEAILERTRSLRPELATARIREIKVGLRPGRSAVRLEAERRPGGPVIYNYGHGGSGYTLSWGCADEVLELMRSMAKDA